MVITWTEAKRLKTLQERGLDFARAAEVFADLHVTRAPTAARRGSRATSPRDFSTGAWW